VFAGTTGRAILGSFGAGTTGRAILGSFGAGTTGRAIVETHGRASLRYWFIRFVADDLKPATNDEIDFGERWATPVFTAKQFRTHIK